MFEKKITYLISLFVFFMTFTSSVYAQDVDCGQAAFFVDGNAMDGVKFSQTDEMACMGEKIMNDCQQGQMTMLMSDKGRVVYKLRKESDDICSVVLEFGDESQIHQEDQKKFANTDLICPINASRLRSNALNSGREERLTNIFLTMFSYLETGINDFDLGLTKCSGSYVDVVKSENTKDLSSYDTRQSFLEVFNADFLDDIQSEFSVVLDNVQGCREEYAKRTMCNYYFVDSKDSSFEKLVIEASKMNYIGATAANFDSVKAEQVAVEFFDDLVKSFDGKYNKVDDGGAINNFKWDSVVEFEVIEKKIIALRSDSWIFKYSFDNSLSGVDNSLVVNKLFNVVNDSEGGGGIDFSIKVDNSDLSLNINHEPPAESDPLVYEARYDLVTGETAAQDYANLKRLEALRNGTNVSSSKDNPFDDYYGNSPLIDPPKDDNPIGVSSMYRRTIVNSEMFERLKGLIILKVEQNGEAYYINPKDKTAYYLGRPKEAFDIMRDAGIGITNEDIEKFPAGFTQENLADTDGDGLSDLFEDAIATNKMSMDTDGDGYSDFEEMTGFYNPRGDGLLGLDYGFAKKHKGKIFLQVSNNGEAWYVYPNDEKRYYLGRPINAFNIMRYLGLGISNKDFDSLFY